MDAAHLIHSVFLGYLWSNKRLFIRSSSGRKRYNVLGALDAVNLKIHKFCNESYINAEVVMKFFKELRKKYGNKPISIFLDNARYQHCKRCIELAEELNIELNFLPSYSPNLNLIERYWKWVKKKCLYSNFYEKFEHFKYAIDECLESKTVEYKNELMSLLSWNFQTFQNVTILNK